MRLAVRFTGAGGQGIGLAGVVLAEAAVRDGRRVVCTQAYGPESRGGASRSDVIVGDEPVAYPVAREVDVLVALTQEACERWREHVAAGGVTVVDAGRVALPADAAGWARTVPVPITDTARRASGSARPANIVAVGVAAALCGAATLAALADAIGRRVPTESVAANLRALEAGWHLGRALRADGWGPRTVVPADAKGAR